MNKKYVVRLHVYTLDVFSESQATAGGDPYAIFQFSTNAVIVPQM